MIDQAKVQKAVEVLAAAAEVSWQDWPRIALLVSLPTRAYGRAAEEAGLEPPPGGDWWGMPALAGALGLEDQELYRLVEKALGLEADPDPDPQDCGMEHGWEWWTAGAPTRLATVAAEALREPGGGLRHPRLGPVPEALLYCTDCGAVGVPEGHTEEVERLLDWCAWHRVDPAGLDEWPRVDACEDGEARCNTCAEEWSRCSEEEDEE